MTPTASPAVARRRRRVAPIAAALSLTAAIGASLSPAAAAATFCSGGGSGWCVARRFPGTAAKGELGFRFGEPLDVDGDGRADVAAGARFTLRGILQAGDATVWSGTSGQIIRRWEGEPADGLFGHWVLPLPDVSGDGLADVIVAAPHAPVAGRVRGVVVARSPKSGAELWRRAETDGENFGWDMTLAGDQDGDGHPDLFVGAPGSDGGRVYLLSGASGAVLRAYDAPAHAASFGWYVARLDDLDGDGRPDVAVGAPWAADDAGARHGGVWVLSAATGKVLRHWSGTDPRGGYGGVVAPVGDLDGDGTGELVVAAPGTEDQTRSIPGEVWIYSVRSGRELRHWSGGQPGELYGRMLIDAGDVDGDGIADLAVGAPYYRRGGDDRVGRMELRSGRTGAVLADVEGDGPDCWFGWHIRRAPDPDGRGRPALLVSSLRHPVDGKVGVGVLDLYVLQRAAAPRPRQGTTRRGARRSDSR